MAQQITKDVEIAAILASAKVIAVVGYSDRPERDSYRVGQYLQQAGYKIYPVNPTVEEIDGLKSYPTLADVPEPIDIVDVFRRSEYLMGVVEAAIQVDAKVVWSQLGVVDQEAAQKAIDAGLDIVMNRCIKVEHARLIN